MNYDMKIVLILVIVVLSAAVLFASTYKTNVLINYCPFCGVPLGEEDIIHYGTNYYEYYCASCGSKGTLDITETEEEKDDK